MVDQESQNSGLQTLFSHSKADDFHDVKTVYGAMSHNSLAWLKLSYTWNVSSFSILLWIYIHNYNFKVL